MVMLHSDSVSGRPFDLHVRTQIEGAFSSIVAMAMKIGEEDLLEIDPTHVHYNGKSQEWSKWTLVQGKHFHTTKTKRKPGTRFCRELDIVLNDKSSIHVRRVRGAALMDFLSVSVTGSASDFIHSQGLLGDYRTGATLGRDGRIISDFNEFGMEWQVQEHEPKLFRDRLRQPQLPHSHCKMPSVSITSETVETLKKTNPKLCMDAQMACAKAGDHLNDCMEDVVLSMDTKVAEAYF